MTALVLALVAGGVVGLCLGALGGGGSVLAVPALIYLMGFDPDQATTASLLVVVTTSATALVAHARAGAVRWRLGVLFAAAGAVPAVAAGVLTRHVPAAVLTGAFGLVAALAAVSVLRRPVEPAAHRVRPVRAAGVGAGLGAMTGFLGVGGGFLVVPALVGALSVPLGPAVGTSLLVITLNGSAALTARLGDLALLDWTALGPFAATALLGAWDGRRLADRFAATTRQRVFAAALLAVAALMAFDTVRRAFAW